MKRPRDKGKEYQRRRKPRYFGFGRKGAGQVDHPLQNAVHWMILTWANIFKPQYRVYGSCSLLWDAWTFGLFTTPFILFGFIPFNLFGFDFSIIV